METENRSKFYVTQTGGPKTPLLGALYSTNHDWNKVRPGEIKLKIHAL